MKSLKFNWTRLIWLVASVALLLVGFIPVRIAATFHQAPIPQAIFVLGGDYNRTKFAGGFWQSHRDLDIWVSDFPRYLDRHRQILKKFGLPDEQLHLDGEATDTVTNFTSLVDTFVNKNLKHFYLITSDYHMQRSRVVATVVLGSRGVVVSPIAVASTGGRSESFLKVLLDFGRSYLWVLSGKTGSNLNDK